jgi:hypothetical protein
MCGWTNRAWGHAAAHLGQLTPSEQKNGAHGGVCVPQPSPAGDYPPAPSRSRPVDHYLSGSQIAPPAARSRQTQGQQASAGLGQVSGRSGVRLSCL